MGLTETERERELGTLDYWVLHTSGGPGGGKIAIGSKIKIIQAKGRTIIFLEGGGGMRNLKKNCLQSLKRQNKLFVQLQNKK